ncbi:MAG: alkaline phosphatase D family protein [Rhodospirillaceae bacterium]|nr:alkaline phosphatase D family protein [Rhodospirillaceae bacterium]
MPFYQPSRRTLLRGAALWAAASAAGLGPVKRALAAPVFLNDPFQLGVASGDPVADGFVIWTRLAPDPFDPEALPPEAIQVAWEVATDEAMKKIVARGNVMARPDMAHSVHVDVRGLAPHHQYYYRFHCGPAVSRTGRALTLPTPRMPVDRLRFAFASCSHLEQGYFTAYRDMMKQDPAFMLHLGDYIYESSWGTPVRHHPGPEPVTLEGYRAYHAAYKMDPDLQAAHAHCPWFVTWDDHEVANDYSRNESETMPDPKEFLARKLAAYKAYYEHMPLRPYAAFDGSQLSLYQRFYFGDLAEFNITDGRQYRDPIPCQSPEKKAGRVVDIAECAEYFDPNRTMFGKAQETWMKNGFAKSNTAWNVLAHALMFTSFDQILGPQRGVFTDSWGGYPSARRKLLDMIKQRNIPNVVTLAGDIHSFFVSDVKDNETDPASATLMSEFVGTSISSESFNTKLFNSLLPENPHIKFCDDTRRGYVMCDVTKDTWRTDLRVVDNVRVREGVFSTMKSFVVENGKPGPQAA